MVRVVRHRLRDQIRHYRRALPVRSWFFGNGLEPKAWSPEPTRHRISNSLTAVLFRHAVDTRMGRAPLRQGTPEPFINPASD